MKLLIKLLLNIIGIGIFVFAIIEEIDGIGRFACVLFGIIFTILGSIYKGEK